MKKVSKLLSLLLCLAMLLSIAACGAENGPEESQTPSESQSPEVSQSAEPSDSPEVEAGWEPVTLTDQAGRQVTIEEEPQRIVSGYYISSSLLIALGLADRMVGIEAKADSRNIYSLAAPELIELPNVGTAKEFNLEGCIALEPDLVILPLKLSEPAEALAELGIPVLLVNPESSELLEEAITLVAAATGTVDKGEELLAYYADKSQELATLLEGVEEKPTVYLAGNSDMLSTAPASMYQSSLITAAGGENVAGEIEDNYWVTVSYEQLIAWDPDYIVIVPEASYTVEDLVNTPQLSALTAVQEGRVYAMPSAFEAWDSPVPSGILGTMWLCSLLHPELYSFETMQTEAADFYKTFYGFDIQMDDLTQG